MVKNCAGCEDDFNYALYCQDEEGLFFATTTERELDFRKHHGIIMVNEFGQVVVEN